MREHRNYMVAVIEIARNGGLTRDGSQRVDGREIGVAVRLLEELLARLQAEGELRLISTRRSSRWRSEQPSTRSHIGSPTTRISTSISTRGNLLPPSTSRTRIEERHDP